MHAATLFENLQSFVRQALDQALATQALWHTLSSRQRVSLWPERQAGKFPLGRGLLGGLSCTLHASVSSGGCEVLWSSRHPFAEHFLG